MRRIVAGFVGAVALATVLVGCSSSNPGSTTSPSSSSSSTPTAEPSPSPSSSPTAKPALLPFGGECSRVIPASQNSQFGLSLVAANDEAPTMGYQADSSASLKAISSFSCMWNVAGSSAAGLYAAVFPSAAITADVRAKHAELFAGQCVADRGECSSILREENGTSVWLVNYSSSLRDSATLAGLADAIAQHSKEFAAPVIGDASADQWKAVPGCDTFTEVVAQSTGWSGLNGGVPTDSVEPSLQTDALAANGVYKWCGTSKGDGSSVFITVMPGVGAWPASVTSSATVSPITVAGADQAFTYSGNAGATFTRTFVIVSVGSNRVTVGFTDPAGTVNAQALAEAVLAKLKP